MNRKLLKYKNQKHVLIILIFFLMLILATPAYAYLDTGIASMVYQTIIAAVFTAAVTANNPW